ncbi:MAG: NUDIX domain-containing protein [Caldilineales bacterium]|nr:NUDIX domain-containing protein [Caldilineales bacterium]
MLQNTPPQTLTFAIGPGATADANIGLGCSIAIMDDAGRLLLQKRMDGDWWCLPGGGVEAGDTFTSAVIREAWEETGLEVEVIRLLGCYTYPDICAVYPDGRRVQVASLNFLGRVVGGAMIESNEETAALRWFARHELPDNIIPTHAERIVDVFNSDHELRIS